MRLTLDYYIKLYEFSFFLLENHNLKLSNNSLHESLFIHVVYIFYLYFMSQQRDSSVRDVDYESFDSMF